MSNPTPPDLPPVDVVAVDAAVLRATGSDDVGVTAGGFVPKPFTRILAEKLALARGILGEDVDLTSASVLRKILEISALEDARTWAALGAMFDNSFIATATGEALSLLGAEVGLARPFGEARGRVTLQLNGTLPADVAEVRIPAGARMLTPGGHDAATAEQVVLTSAQRVAEVAVSAFQPGPEGNLDPLVSTVTGTFPQRLERWNLLDPALAGYAALVARTDGQVTVGITHSAPLTGGTLRWPDDRYRALLLRAPRRSRCPWCPVSGRCRCATAWAAWT
ncbi:MULTISPECIES: baseplate J/gp47 family protein [unclassified Frankia]